MKILKFRFESVSPLLQHDDKMANPFNDYTKRMKAISSKRKKTDDDLMEMARIEWVASLYHTERKGYYMKAECIEAAMLAAAKDKKLGKAFQAAVSVPDDPVFHFEHESLPPEELFRMDAYRDFRTVKVQRAKILRCRPIFCDWHCDVDIWYEESRWNERELKDVVDFAGRYVGICDYRPKFGRFKAIEIKQ